MGRASIQFKVAIILIFGTFLLLSGCSDIQIRPHHLKIGVLPEMDAFPVYAASKNNYYFTNGVTVELISATTTEELDALLKSGQIDGAVTDLVSILTATGDPPHAMVVRTCLTPTDQKPRLQLLSGPGYPADSALDLKGAQIGVSKRTEDEYVLDTLLQQAGLLPSDYTKINVAFSRDLYDLLISGKLQAAILPEPLSSFAILKGAHAILTDSTAIDSSFSVIAFNIGTIRDRPEAVRGFLAGIERAVAEINQNRGGWTDLISEYNLMHASLRGTYSLPTYPTASVPTESQFNDVLIWVLGNELLNETQYYENFVTSEYLP